MKTQHSRCFAPKTFIYDISTCDGILTCTHDNRTELLLAYLEATKHFYCKMVLTHRFVFRIGPGLVSLEMTRFDDDKDISPDVISLLEEEECVGKSLYGP